MKHQSCLLVLVTIAAASLACNHQNQSTDSSFSRSTAENSTTSTKGTIGVSLMTLTNPFFKVIGDTITAEALPHGYNTVVLGANEDAVKQTAQVKDFIVKRVSAIVLAPYDSHGIGPVIAEANDAGIPVFTVDNGCLSPDGKVVCHVATDNLQGGEQAGHAMIEYLGEQGGKIAILDHKLTQSCIDRVTGFKKVLNQHNETADNPIEVVSELKSGGNRQTGYASTQDILQSHPDIVGVFAINDPSALGAHAAIDEDGKLEQIVIIGFDGQPEGKKAIRDGKIFADPIQFPDRMAKMTVDIILRHFDGETVKSEVLIPTELYRKADADADESL